MDSEKIWFAVVMICLIGLGWCGGELYHSLMNKRYLDGFYLQNQTLDAAKEYRSSNDKYGDWVCVNVRGMDYKRCVETSQHECGHEIFSEVVEKHPEKINDVMEVIGK